MSLKRIDLVAATGVLSAYKKKSNPLERWDISALKEGAQCSPDMFDAVIQVNQAVKEQNGTLYITDMFRTWVDQESARNDYLSGKKKAFVAPPGGSFHQAARAIDFSTSELNFRDVPKDKWLKKFWDIVKPIGFHPIIRMPVLGMSECWHFDYPGKAWAKAYDYMDDSSSDHVDYSYVAKCAILDIGAWDPKENPIKIRNMFIQAQLVRLGHYQIGSIDGIIGKKSQLVLQSLGLDATDLDKVAEELKKK